MEITCIGHSGFLIELPEYNLIFDYYTDNRSIVTPVIFKAKKTCVFVSHKHVDHYNEKIFKWSNWGELIYIIDEGCEVPEKENIVKVREGENLEVFNGMVKVKTYGSTDEGVSFLVMIGNFTVFHAGDLNDWYWEDKSTPEELAENEENYFNIIIELAYQKIDVAFIPRDPRLGRNADRGIQHFKDIVAPELIIPMHFPGNDGEKHSFI